MMIQTHNRPALSACPPRLTSSPGAAPAPSIAPRPRRRRPLAYLVALGVAVAGAPLEAGVPSLPNDFVWAPTYRPELLFMSWNTPVDGVPEEPVEPDPEGAGPVAVELSEDVIDTWFFGIIDLTVSGLSPGQSAVLEKFKVDNAEGRVTEGSFLLEKHVLTDGLAEGAGEVFNFNRVQDVTDRDGQIVAQVDFWEPNTASIAGEYVYRISSPVGSFAPTTARLTVEDAVSTQAFTGVVTSGGEPVEGAVVALLDPLSTTRDFVVGTSTGPGGSYFLFAPGEDEFDVLVAKPGYVGAFAHGTDTIIWEGELLELDLVLEQGTREVAGTLTDAESGEPLGGVELFFFPLDAAGAFDLSRCTVEFTDGEGRFAARVTPGRWGALVRDGVAYRLGYVTRGRGPLAVADATEGDVSGVEVQLRRGRSLIWGSVFSDTYVSTEPGSEGWPLPLSGVEINAYNPDTGEAAWGVTDGGGDYRIAVTPGRWLLRPFPLSLAEVDHGGAPPVEVTVPAEGQSVWHAVFARPVEGVAWGFVEDAAGEPVGRLLLSARDADLGNRDATFQSTYQSDGFFFFGLPAGTWLLFPDPQQSAERGLLYEDLPVMTIGEGADEVEASFRVVAPEATIELALTGPGGAPLPGLYAHAWARVGGHTYDSFGGSGEDGVIRLPALPGEWEIHVSENNLSGAGMQPLPLLHATVEAGATVEVAQQAEPFTGSRPSLTAISVVDGVVRLEGRGESGRRFGVEVSRDLVSWLRVGGLRAVDGRFEVVDVSGAIEPRVFYRAVAE